MKARLKREAIVLACVIYFAPPLIGLAVLGLSQLVNP